MIVVRKPWHPIFRKLDTQPVAAAAGAALLVIASIAMAIVVLELRTDALEEARRNIANLAFVLGEQTARSAQAVDLALRNLQDTIEETQADSDDSFERVISSGPFRLELKEMSDRVHQADFLAIIDAHGRLASTSNTVTGLDVSQRDYFRYLSSNNDTNVFIGAPARNIVTGVKTIYFARRISSRSGAFLGLIVCGVPIRYFEEIYSSIDLPRKESFLLARRDHACYIVVV